MNCVNILVFFCAVSSYANMESFAVQIEHPVTRADRSSAMTHDDDGVALAAAWENYVVYGESSKHIQDSVARFAGFVEGRLRINLPRYWQANLMTAKQIKEPSVQIRGVNFKIALQKTEFRIETLRNEEKPKAFYKSIELPISLPSGVNYLDSNNVTVLSETEHVFALYNYTLAESFPLVFLDKMRHRKWKATVLGNGNGDAVMGHDYHSVEIITTDRHIYVFGISFSNAYIERFDLESGESTMRFSTKNKIVKGADKKLNIIR